MSPLPEASRRAGGAARPGPARTDGPGAPSAAPLSVSVHADVSELPAAEWDALLAPDDLLASHRFVAACQRARVERAAWRHVAVRQGGRLVAVAPLSCMRVRLDLLAGTALRGGAALVRRAWPGFLAVPMLLGGLPVSFGTSCLRARPEVDAGALAAALAGAAEAAAAELGAPVVAFKEFPDAERPLADRLADHGYFAAWSLPGCALELPWGSEESWVAAMRAGYRRQVRAALRARGAAGLTVRVAAGLAGERDRIAALYGQVMDRAPHQLERLPPAFLDELEAAFGDDLRTVLVRAGGELVAAALLLRAPGTWWFLLVGLDYARARDGLVYQNLVHEVVAEALRGGARRVELGQTSYAMKGRLGGVPSDRVVYLRCRRPLVHAALAALGPALFPRRWPPPRRVFKAPAGGAR